VYDGDNLVERPTPLALWLRAIPRPTISTSLAMLRSGRQSYYQADGIGVQLLQFSRSCACCKH